MEDSMMSETDEKNFGEGGGVLEITLDSGPNADDTIVGLPKHINHEYVQHTIKGITRSFTLFDDIYLNYSRKNCNPKAFRLKFFRDKDVELNRINLTYLDPNPDHMVHIAWNWFVNGLAAIAWAFVIIYVGEYTDFSLAHDVMLPTGILLGTFGIISFLIFFYKTQDKIIYKSFTGQVPVFEVFHRPRSEDYNAFIDLLEESIYKAHKRNGITMKHRLVGELKYVRRLNETDLIAEDVYEMARSKILGHSEYQI
jgi:hypothetical protein